MSGMFQLDNVKSEAILQRLPQLSKLATSKTKQFCETPQFSKLRTSKNKAILRDFLQNWKVECRADGLVPMRFAIFQNAPNCNPSQEIGALTS